jgi:trans-2,3-dihydro-3-hydroxyanthranilate isomerase
MAFSKGTERPAAAVAGLCGLPEAAILSRTHAPCYASVGTGFLVAEVTHDGLAAAVPDLSAFAAETADAPAGHLPALFLWADLGHAGPELRVEARMFAPLSGVPEDPATGSAAAALGGLLAALGGPTSLSVAQGERIGRPSRIRVEARHDGVWISGEAVPVMEGRLL